ncbi:MAG: PIG-L family deacetylase [Ktedonobacteraceae bacterium]|nr:PIG-L family deacetylase [Ktedonobacteraceae bacterium]
MQLTSFDDITTKYRHIFLSPHFDDAVFSCGGTLGMQVSCGLRPLVITVFGGMPSSDMRLSPFAQQVHSTMGGDAAQNPEALVQRRRKEDATALDYLQVDYLWLNYLDAIYRGNPAYYTTYSQLFGGEINPNDFPIDKQFAQDLLALQERLPDTAWYAPLGVGGHVDHQLVTSAADRLVQAGAKVYFYEELPYALQEGAVQARLNELGGAFEPRLVEMSEMLPLRLEATKLYVSQIAPQFEDIEKMRRAIATYTHTIRPVETVHLERYWVAQ